MLDVGAHLVAPGGGGGAAQLVDLGLLLLALELEELGLEDAHRGGLVLELRALVLAGDDHAGRQVRQAHGRVGGVDALAAGPGGAVDVDADLVVGDVDLVGLLEGGDDLDGGEAGLAAALVVVFADAHDAVGALLDREGAVGVGAVDGEGGRADARLFGVGDVVDLGGEVVGLGPPQVHAHELFGEVAGVGAAGARADRDDAVAFVVFAREQGAHLQLVDGLADGGEFGENLGVGARVVLVPGELEEDLDVVHAPVQAGELVELGLDVGQAGGDLLGVLGVVPQSGVGGGGLEFVLLPSQRGQIEDGLDAR